MIVLQRRHTAIRFPVSPSKFKFMLVSEKLNDLNNTKFNYFYMTAGDAKTFRDAANQEEVMGYLKTRVGTEVS